jgi:hypothetical protein
VVKAQNYVFYFESDISKVFPFRPILVPHIDRRVKIIDNERPGANPCDLLKY